MYICNYRNGRLDSPLESISCIDAWFLTQTGNVTLNNLHLPGDLAIGKPDGWERKDEQADWRTGLIYHSGLH